MSLVYLRVKIKSLAAEARIIRLEEQRFPRGWRNNDVYHGLHHHRTYDVRKEARSALLAYAYLRGRLYSVVEGGRNENRSTEPDVVRVGQLIYKYGTIINKWTSKEGRYDLQQQIKFGWVRDGAAPLELSARDNVNATS